MVYQEGHALDNASLSPLQDQTSSSGEVTAEPTSTTPPAYTQEDPLQSTSRSNSSIAGKISNQSTNQWNPDSGFSKDRSLKSLEYAHSSYRILVVTLTWEYRGSSKPRRKVSILFMGDTGVGKSSFISKLTGSAVKVGHSLMPSTTNLSMQYRRDN